MHRTTTAALAGLATLALTIPAPSATAAERTFRDPAGDSGAATDIRRVDVSYTGKALRVVIRYPGSTLRDSFPRVWIDSRRKDKGPEFRASAIPNSEDFGMRRTENFNRPDSGAYVTCPRFRVFADGNPGAPPRSRFVIPARCIGDPSKVRVAVEMVSLDDASSDWSRDVRRFLPWLTQD